ncbi:MAG: YigZ family protein [Flavobacterium sp.]|jgi:uncharacterized YigZ family protein
MSDLNKDTYKTILISPEPSLFKEKNSKFFGYAFPVTNEEQVKTYIEELKKEHHSARHWCYAYQIGTKNTSYRANDDGEPNNSAGMPIYGQIQSFDVTNILIVVVRYFGGVKLGVGGLITAYKTAAQMVLENAQIEEKTIDINYIIKFEYINMNKVMRVIKEKNIDIINQKMEMSCEIEIAIRINNAENIYETFKSIYEIDIFEKE